MTNREPDFLQNVRAELSDIRLWIDRGIVLGYAVLAGLCVVAFTIAADWAFAHFRSLERAYPWAILVWTPALHGAMLTLGRSTTLGGLRVEVEFPAAGRGASYAPLA